MKSLLAIPILCALGGCTALLAVNAKLECLGPPPAVEGKFPFRITYVNHGVRGVIEDTRICKLEARECTGGGWEEYWEDSYASGRQWLVIPPGADGRRYMVVPHGACRELMADSRPPNTFTVFLLEGEKETAIFDEDDGVKPDVYLQYKDDLLPYEAVP
jgi:hypothetical protein